MNQSTYQGRPIPAAIGLFFSIPKEPEKLEGDCFEKSGRFHSVIKWKGSKINLGVFDTSGECNAVWIRSMNRRKIKARAPSRKGYTKATIGNMQKASLQIDGVPKYIGTFETPELARAAYLDAFHAETKRLLEELN